MSSSTILVADDDTRLTEGLRWYLEAEGHRVVTAADGVAALEVFRTERPDLVVLDIMMPGVDGVSVCETISKESETLVLMLSARDTEIDKVRALKIGADDYVTKPFNASELVARIAALLRRRDRKTAAATTLKWHNLEVSLVEHRVRVDRDVVELTPLEFELLAALMLSPRSALSREQLVERVWGDDFYGAMRLVDNLVFRLRDKLGKAGCRDFPLMTVRGVGYAFRPEG